MDFTKIPQKIVLVGDAFVSADTMEQAVQSSALCCGEITKLMWGSADKQEFTARQLKLERNGPESVSYADRLDEAIADAEVLMVHFNPVPRALLDKAKNLKLILTCRGGLEHIDLAAASERNIPVLNVIRNAEPVADFALGMMLCLTRDIALSHCKMREGVWSKTFYNSEFLMTMSSHTVALAGIGNVGAALARRLLALGVPVIAYDAYTSLEKLKKAGLDAIELVDSLETLFERGDIVSLHLRLTPETERMIGMQYFSRMKKTAYFINTARGGLVDQSALAEALQKGCMAGAALDVYDSEPLAADDPLLTMDNVLLTPHIAGTTVDAIPRAPFLLMREVDRFLESGVTDRVVNHSSVALD